MPVFTEGPRCDVRLPYPKESAVAYLDRSADPAADALRSLIEDWLERYPAGEAPNLAARLRSRRDDQHRSAFFELLLHRLLLTLGHGIPAIEPKLPHTWKSPDFMRCSSARPAAMARWICRWWWLSWPRTTRLRCDALWTNCGLGRAARSGGSSARSWHSSP